MGIYIGKEKVIHYHNPTHGKDKGILGKTGALTLVAIAIVTTAVGAKKVSEKNSGIKRQERRVDLSYAR